MPVWLQNPKKKKKKKKNKNLHLPFLWPSSNLSSELNVNRKKLPTLSDSAQSHADSEQPWRGFCLIRGKILLSWSVLVVSFLNCIWSRACFALKRQKKTNDLLHIWHYLLSILKNDLTRSPSWDEHISFSRVPWPSSRHQVNTLFCSIQGQKWAFRWILNGPGFKFLLQVLLLSESESSVGQFSHIWKHTKCPRQTITETKRNHIWCLTCHVYLPIIRWILKNK